MAATTEAVALAVLKNLFEGDGATEQQRDFNPTLDQFEKSTDDIEGGKDIIFPLQNQFQQGLGARTDTQELPTPGRANYTACQFPLKKLAFSVQITTSAWMKSKAKGVASFVDLVGAAGSDVKGGLRRDLNGQLYRDGTGLLSTVNGAITGPDVNVVVTLDTIKWFFEGMLLDIYAAGGTVPVQTEVEVTGVDVLNLQITLAAIDATIADGSELYRSGNKDNEIMGLSGFVSDTSGPATMQGITVADNVTWRANDLDNGGTARDLERNLIEQAVRAGMGVDQTRPDCILSGLVQARKYAMMLVIKDEYEKSDKGGRITLDYGYEKLKMGNIPLTEDPDCPDDRIYFLHKKDLKIWQLGKPDFVYSPDAKFAWYRIPGMPFYRADGEWFLQFGGKRRNNQTVLRDLVTTG